MLFVVINSNKNDCISFKLKIEAIAQVVLKEIGPPVWKTWLIFYNSFTLKEWRYI